ncbi:uncharacterized protein LOC119166824 isoform X2 [Rhipicephalus microplus]|uniref:uncharacterized protein LOC119166824 isoform X2 n=1 Tax=Rhipicephalus microplus TaxID=6941 RepID=UPI003F6AB00F
MSMEALKLLCSPTSLERDRGYQEAQRYLTTAQGADASVFEAAVLAKLQESDKCSWETKIGALLSAKAIVEHRRSSQQASNEEFDESVARVCISLVTDPSVNVRLEAGQVLGTLCAVDGVKLYAKYHKDLTRFIETYLDKDPSECGSFQEELKSETGGVSSDGSSAAKVLLNTVGWRHLETSMKCLQYVIDGCGASFEEFVDNTLLELLCRTVQHVSRFVRETTFCVISSLITCCSAMGSKNPFAANHYGPRISKCLALGLADNWSQVRLAASEATRKFLLSFTEKERELFFPDLLPQMCLNRYYTADGVRIYSQETWRRIAKTEGRELVQRHINGVIAQDVVRPHVSRLFQTLLVCFRDPSWAVRDAACLACGNFMLCYPEESKASLKTVYPLFFNNLQDCIPSVRQGAAAALANVVRAYGQEAFEVVKPKITEGLAGVAKQPAETLHYRDIQGWGAGSGSSATPNIKAMKKLHDNDPALHTNQPAYSCESLAPRAGLPTDWNYRKPSEPWELADGCIHLIAELSQVPQVSTSVAEFLPALSEASRHRHYVHHVVLLETLCSQLPNIVKGVGKRVFKMHIELFLEPIFYSLNCENALTSSAASQCLNQLASLFGPSILRARVEQWNPRYLEQLDANLHIAGL